MINPVDLDGTPTLRDIARPSIKLASKPTIVIAIPCGDKEDNTVLRCPTDQGGCGQKYWVPGTRSPLLVPIQFSLAKDKLITPLNTVIATLVQAGRLSGEARQIMTKEAIRMGAKYILYWDDDTLPPQQGLRTLYSFMERNPEAGAVSAVYTTRQAPIEPLIYRAHGEGAWWDFPMGDGAEPQPIFGAGAGFLLARVSSIVDTIEQLRKEHGEEIPIWADERIMPGDEPDMAMNMQVMIGHDIRFCRLLNMHGHPVYVHGEVLCKHLDIATQTMYEVPVDAPGRTMQRQKNINTKDYWDEVYGREGADSWRKYPEMFQRVAEEVPYGGAVAEFGCGPGIFGSMLTARRQVTYCGFDISEVAVMQCDARFLNASVFDLRNLEDDPINDCGRFYDLDAVIATEVLEHLDEATRTKFLQHIDFWKPDKFIFTVPNGTMPPERVPEHVENFDKALVRKICRPYTRNGWKLRIKKAGDGQHIVCVLERKDGKENASAEKEDR